MEEPPLTATVPFGLHVRNVGAMVLASAYLPSGVPSILSFAPTAALNQASRGLYPEAKVLHLIDFSTSVDGIV